MLPAKAGFKLNPPARGAYAPEGKANIFNHRNTLSILRIKLKLHCVQNLRLTQKLGKRGRFAKVSLFIIFWGTARLNTTINWQFCNLALYYGP